MYHWVDSRNFSGSKNLQALNLISKTSNHLFRNRFELNNFNRLPVIKEEGGNPEDDDLELQHNLLRSVLQNHYRNRKGTHTKDSMNDIKNFEKVMASKSITRLPPLASINCLVVNGIKETEHVWETPLGKSLMNRKNSGDLNFYETKVPPNETKEECGDCPPSRFLLNRKSVHEQNGKNAGDKAGFGLTRSNRKPKNVRTKDQNLGKKFCQDKLQTEKLFEGSFSAKSSFSKSQHFTSESTQCTVFSHSNEINCKDDRTGFSNESSSNAEELSRQKKHNETKREICHLCEKVFYDPQQYAQHLLTHDIADKFSCKICKIHFLSIRKYKQHCRDFHFTSANEIRKQCLECEKKWVPKFECKRCKAAFEMEQNFETHKRIHAENDMAEKYL